MNPTTLAAIVAAISALAALLTSVATLLKQLQTNGLVAQIHTNTVPVEPPTPIKQSG